MKNKKKYKKAPLKDLSTKHLNGERRVINGVKVLILKTGEPPYQAPKGKRPPRKTKGLYS
jgi:hypothetical protein